MNFFIDIGTHYGEGLTELNKKLNLADGWIIHCFEPNPETDSVSVVKELTKEWNSSIFIHKKAVWNETKDVEFLCSKRDPGELKEHYTSKWPECYTSEISRNNLKLDGVSSHIIGVRQNTWGGDTKVINAVSGTDILKSLSLKPEDKVYIKIDAEGAEKEIVESFLSSEYTSNIKEIYCEVHETISTSGVSSHYIQTICDNAGVSFKRWF